MIDNDGISKLNVYIEENLRTSQNQGMDFIDPKHYSRKMHSKQNHVAFGRRGSGKSTLLSCLNNMDKCFNSYVNIEQFKNISFPNVLLYVLKSLLEDVFEESKRIYPWYRLNLKVINSRGKIKNEIKALEKILSNPDTQEIELRLKDSSESQANGKLNSPASELSTLIKEGYEKEEKKVLVKNKLEDLQLSITRYKQLLDDISKCHNSINIFLTLDDLYFLNKKVQPHFVDFFHRLSKGSNLFLKIATIKHRSILYSQVEGSYIGMETGHDIHEIDMDYSLENFDELKDFMTSLLENAIEKSKSKLILDDLFAGVSFQQLCLASGGVPRDFLSLFLKLSESKLMLNHKISKIDVTETAINNITSKFTQINTDSGSESETLEDYLHQIKKRIYTDKRTNVFLVSKSDLEVWKQARQAIKELVDMRLIHIVDNNTSCAPSDGKRYEAYIIDVGLYDNSRPREFKQIEPGITDKVGRKDSIRSAPKLDLEVLQNSVLSKDLQITMDDVEITIS